MPEGKHTPGPWRWEVHRQGKNVKLCGGDSEGGFGSYDLNVMSFNRWGMSGAAPVFWKWKGHVGRPERADELAVPVPGREHHADWFADIDHPDARLISSAPDLLEALEECLPFIGYGQHVPDVIAKVEAAISKAKGSPTPDIGAGS